jgi:CHAT domain-containing protein
MTTPPDMKDCPTEEMLAAFIDDRLAAEERQTLIEHIAGCAECRDVVVAAQEFAEMEGGEVQGGRLIQVPARRWRIVAAVAAAIVLVLVLGPFVRNRLAPPSGMEALVRASESSRFRPVNGRLGGGFPYKPVRPVVRGESAEGPSNWEIFEPAQKIREEAEKTPDPAHLRALGVALLWAGQHEQAIQSFQDALEKETGVDDANRAIEQGRNPGLLADLAAAYLSPSSDSAARKLMALAAADRAVRLDSRNVEALFNRALALEMLGQRADAIEAWEAYLQADPASSWADEARRSLAGLRKSGSAWLSESSALAWTNVPEESLRDSQRTRNYAEDELFGQWGRLIVAQRFREAAEVFTRLRALAGALARVTGDHMLEAEISSVEACPDKRLAALGHVAYSDARILFRKSTDERARAEFAAAASQLATTKSPLEYRARVFAATIDQYAARNSDAASAMVQLREKFAGESESYPSVAGQAEWVAGLAQYTLGRYDDALDSYRRARQFFERSQDRGNLAGVLSVHGECLRRLGYEDEAWQSLLQAADLCSLGGSRQRKYVVLSQCANLATQNQHFGAARYFADRARLAAKANGDPVLEADALILLAELNARLGNQRQSFDAATQAGEVSARITSVLKSRLLCRSAIARAAALASLDADQALDAISQAEVLATQNSLSMFQPEIHYQKSKVLGALGRSADARLEAERGIEVFRKQVPSNDPVDRAMFAGVGLQLANRMSELTVDSDQDAAWRAGMRARDFSLDLRPSDGSRLVAFHALDHELLIWVLHGRQRFVARTAISSAALQNEVRTFSSGASAGISVQQLRESGGRLYEILFRPIEKEISGSSRIVVAADPILTGLPLGLLFDRVKQQWLIERSEILVLAPVPEDPHAIRHLDDSRKKSLFVAAAPDGGGSLSQLDGARRESLHLAAMWPGSDLEIGQALTPEAFIRGALTHDIVHFAGHVTQQEDPNRAALRLSSKGVEGGRLTSRDLTNLSRRPPWLVVLSACSAASGRPTAVGPLSVARPFFSAGVSYLIASIWDADDGRTAELMLPFYKRLKNGEAPASALRAVQLSLLREPTTDPRIWAGFQVYVNQLAI